MAGTYSGSLTVTRATSEQLTGTMEMTVLQFYRDVTIQRPETFPGVPLIPGLIGVIDEAGVFEQTGGGTDYDVACGIVMATETALSFFGLMARYESALFTVECGRFQLDATLEKK